MSDEGLGAYRPAAARAFDRACQLTGLPSTELCRQLAARLGRRTILSRQTLTAWRRGRQAVPLGAFLAAADLAGIRPPVIFALSAEEFDSATMAAAFQPPEAPVRGT